VKLAVHHVLLVHTGFHQTANINLIIEKEYWYHRQKSLLGHL